MTLRIQVAVVTILTAFASAAAQQSLKDTYKDSFLIGAAVNRAQFSEEDARGVDLIRRQFDSISPENALKWASVHPSPGEFDFADADRYVAFGEK